MASLPGLFNLQEITSAGALAESYRLYTYAPGTTTHKAIYTDAAGLVPHTYTSDGIGGLYIPLDARGELPAPPFCASGGYDFVLKSNTGATVRAARRVIGSEDAGSAAVTALRDDLASSTDPAKGGALSGFTPIAYGIKTMGAAVADSAVNILWFCTTEGQRTAIKAKTYADDSTALFATAYAWANGRSLYLPAGGYKISAATLNKAGSQVFGDGWSTVIRASDPTQHLFTVNVSGVRIHDMELHGAATGDLNNTFAVFTDVANPAVSLTISGVKFSGQAVTHGFNNAVKFDDGCHHGKVLGCYFERLWGSSASGRGYGVLVGNATGVMVFDSDFYGSTSRGRHAVYFSAGANGCVAAYNYCESFYQDAFTQFSQGAQPACEDNIFAHNKAKDCATVAASTNASFSIAGHSKRAKLIGNISIGSKSCGIKIEGTGVTDLMDTALIDNTVVDSDIIGIDIFSGVGGQLTGGLVKDSSKASVGGSPNVRFIGDGTTAVSGWAMSGVRIPASAFAKSAIQLNATTPVPAGITIDGCNIGSGTVTDYEFAAGTSAPVNGRIRYSTTHNPGNIVANSSEAAATFTVTGAAVGDRVEAWHEFDTGGMYWHGKVTAANTVQVWWGNVSGSNINPDNGTLYIDVLKR